MTELDLYKFLNKESGIEQYNWEGDEFLIWIDFDLLSDFTKMIGHSYLAEGGMDCNLQDRLVCLNIVDVCEFHGIDLENILKKPD